MSKAKLNQTLGTSAFRSRITSTRPTVTSAFSTLKQEEDMVTRQHNRYKVLNLRTSRQNVSQKNMEKHRMFITTARDSAERDKQVKKAYEQQKIEEIKNRYSMNLKHREVHRKMIESIKKNFLNANHELYEQMKLKRKENDETASMNRSFYMESNSIKRRKAVQQRSMRKKSIEKFYVDKLEEMRLKKEEQVKEMLRVSEERHRFYEALSSRNSRINDNKVSQSRSMSNGSIKNPQNRTLPA